LDLKIRNLDGVERIHLMGIGGAGMSGLALLLKDLGYDVSGCDVNWTSYVDKVVRDDISFMLQHGKEHLDELKPDLLIYSSAIPDDNEELCEAWRRGIRIAKRGEVLSWIFDARFGIGIAGTHGKTTTSSMIALILEQSGLSPTLAIGGELCDIGVNAKLGKGPYMVAELDESDGSFEGFHPNIAVLTNADWDHVNHYPTFDSVIDAFNRFLVNPKEDGVIVLCAEDVGLMKVMERNQGKNDRKDIITYGWGNAWDWGAYDVEHVPGGGVSFSVSKKGEYVDQIELSVSGDHNVMNALAACVVADHLEVPFTIIKKTLRSFRGAKRRMQYIGAINGVDIYDDYGHHPREVAATLNTLGQMFPGRRLNIIFQPHRYTRTAAMYRDFAEVLSSAGRLFLLPVYPADEEPIEGVNSALICTELDRRGFKNYRLCSDMFDAVSLLKDTSLPGDVIVTVGAGDVPAVGEMLLEEIEKKQVV
jgi:UDP-N-acetylmuramate--alanine ligase